MVERLSTVFLANLDTLLVMMRGMRKRFADGKVTVPFGRFLGYDRGEDGNLVINEEQAKTVREIYGVHRVPRKPRHALGDDEVNFSVQGILHHFVESLAVPCGSCYLQASLDRRNLTGANSKGR